MNKLMKSCALCMFLGAQNVLAGTFGGMDSLSFMLSHFFSMIECGDEAGIEVTLMDTPFHWTLSDLGKVRCYRDGKVGEKVRLVPGDRFAFLAGRAGLTVTVTNGAYREGMVKIPERFADSGHLVVFDGYGFRPPKERQTDSGRQLFVYDVSRRDVFDVERNAFGRLNLPFRALWRDWDDYLEHFSGERKVDFVESSLQNAMYLRERAERSQTLRDFCQNLTNDALRVVRYWTENYGTNFALVRKHEGEFKVLGVARARQDGGLWTYMMDERGSLRWKGGLFSDDGGREFQYEFDGGGAVCRFVELDGRGRELRWRDRLFKDGKMLAPEARAAFRAEAEAAARPLVEAWTNRSFAVVPNVPPPPPEEARRIAEENAKREREKREREEKYARINRERQAAGLPPLTMLDRSRILRDETNELVRRRLEKLRQEATGRLETTEFDAATDWERVRLGYLATVLELNHERLFVNAASGSWPKTLRDLIGLMRHPKINVPLLLNGEKDIRDQWGREYRYHPGDVTKTPFGRNRPLITSAGPDGVFDTADDITSFDEFMLQKQKEEREHAADRRAE